MPEKVEDDIAVAVTYHPGKDRFLLLRRSGEMDVFPGAWDFPGGSIEKGEDAGKAALRELEEETGLLGTVIRTGEKHLVATRYGSYRLHPFLVKVDSGEVELNREHTEHRWVEPREVREMETVKELEKDFQLVGVEK